MQPVSPINSVDRGQRAAPGAPLDGTLERTLAAVRELGRRGIPVYVASWLRVSQLSPSRRSDWTCWPKTGATPKRPA